ncbi:MAG TPA: TlpA disulfide reductase family protein [Chloroflexia bacterium]|nr:TlpA disulfide reductase family protein [Chloroflexia bacterium]
MLLPRRSRWGAGAALGVLLAALLAWAGAHGRPGPSLAFDLPVPPAGAAAPPRVGMLAPDFQLADVNTGRPIQLAALRGRPVWINFWATWCEACKLELPTMQQAYARYKSRGLALVGVDMREEPDQVRAFTQAQGYDWLIGIDADMQVRNRYHTVGIPNHLFVDAHGVIQAISLGPLAGNALAADLAKILGDGAGGPGDRSLP